ncbi:MAG: hypothetical protein EXX96DRAFT_585458 [Benjaminiella poitrasii]|nr:MAG: hypothetical protein EXX96DRAFT_585458 [Benjaminiella poitrasii]
MLANNNNMSRQSQAPDFRMQDNNDNANSGIVNDFKPQQQQVLGHDTSMYPQTTTSFSPKVVDKQEDSSSKFSLLLRHCEEAMKQVEKDQENHKINLNPASLQSLSTSRDRLFDAFKQFEDYMNRMFQSVDQQLPPDRRINHGSTLPSPTNDVIGGANKAHFDDDYARLLDSKPERSIPNAMQDKPHNPSRKKTRLSEKMPGSFDTNSSGEEDNAVPEQQSGMETALLTNLVTSPPPFERSVSLKDLRDDSQDNDHDADVAHAPTRHDEKEPLYNQSSAFIPPVPQVNEAPNKNARSPNQDDNMMHSTSPSYRDNFSGNNAHNQPLDDSYRSDVLNSLRNAGNNNRTFDDDDMANREHELLKDDSSDRLNKGPFIGHGGLQPIDHESERFAMPANTTVPTATGWVKPTIAPATMTEPMAKSNDYYRPLDDVPLPPRGMFNPTFESDTPQDNLSTLALASEDGFESMDKTHDTTQPNVPRESPSSIGTNAGAMAALSPMDNTQFVPDQSKDTRSPSSIGTDVGATVASFPSDSTRYLNDSIPRNHTDNGMAPNTYDNDDDRDDHQSPMRRAAKAAAAGVAAAAATAVSAAATAAAAVGLTKGASDADDNQPSRDTPERSDSSQNMPIVNEIRRVNEEPAVAIPTSDIPQHFEPVKNNFGSSADRIPSSYPSSSQSDTAPLLRNIREANEENKASPEGYHRESYEGGLGGNGTEPIIKNDRDFEQPMMEIPISQRDPLLTELGGNESEPLIKLDKELEQSMMETPIYRESYEGGLGGNGIEPIIKNDRDLETPLIPEPAFQRESYEGGLGGNGTDLIIKNDRDFEQPTMMTDPIFQRGPFESNLGGNRVDPIVQSEGLIGPTDPAPLRRQSFEGGLGGNGAEPIIKNAQDAELDPAEQPSFADQERLRYQILGHNTPHSQLRFRKESFEGGLGGDSTEPIIKNAQDADLNPADQPSFADEEAKRRDRQVPDEIADDWNDHLKQNVADAPRFKDDNEEVRNPYEETPETASSKPGLGSALGGFGAMVDLTDAPMKANVETNNDKPDNLKDDASDSLNDPTVTSDVTETLSKGLGSAKDAIAGAVSSVISPIMNAIGTDSDENETGSAENMPVQNTIDTTPSDRNVNEPTSPIDAVYTPSLATGSGFNDIDQEEGVVPTMPPTVLDDMAEKGLPSLGPSDKEVAGNQLKEIADHVAEIKNEPLDNRDFINNDVISTPALNDIVDKVDDDLVNHGVFDENEPRMHDVTVAAGISEEPLDDDVVVMVDQIKSLPQVIDDNVMIETANNNDLPVSVPEINPEDIADEAPKEQSSFPTIPAAAAGGLAIPTMLGRHSTEDTPMSENSSILSDRSGVISPPPSANSIPTQYSMPEPINKVDDELNSYKRQHPDNVTRGMNRDDYRPEFPSMLNNMVAGPESTNNIPRNKPMDTNIQPADGDSRTEYPSMMANMVAGPGNDNNNERDLPTRDAPSFDRGLSSHPDIQNKNIAVPATPPSSSHPVPQRHDFEPTKSDSYRSDDSSKAETIGVAAGLTAAGAPAMDKLNDTLSQKAAPREAPIPPPRRDMPDTEKKLPALNVNETNAPNLPAPYGRDASPAGAIPVVVAGLPLGLESLKVDPSDKLDLTHCSPNLNTDTAPEVDYSASSPDIPLPESSPRKDRDDHGDIDIVKAPEFDPSLPRIEGENDFAKDPVHIALGAPLAPSAAGRNDEGFNDTEVYNKLSSMDAPPKHADIDVPSASPRKNRDTSSSSELDDLSPSEAYKKMSSSDAPKKSDLDVPSAGKRQAPVAPPRHDRPKSSDDKPNLSEEREAPKEDIPNMSSQKKEQTDHEGFYGPNAALGQDRSDTIQPDFKNHLFADNIYVPQRSTDVFEPSQQLTPSALDSPSLLTTMIFGPSSNSNMNGFNNRNDQVVATDDNTFSNDGSTMSYPSSEIQRPDSDTQRPNPERDMPSGESAAHKSPEFMTLTSPLSAASARTTPSKPENNTHAPITPLMNERSTGQPFRDESPNTLRFESDNGFHPPDINDRSMEQPFREESSDTMRPEDNNNFNEPKLNERTKGHLSQETPSNDMRDESSQYPKLMVPVVTDLPEETTDSLMDNIVKKQLGLDDDDTKRTSPERDNENGSSSGRLSSSLGFGRSSDTNNGPMNVDTAPSHQSPLARDNAFGQETYRNGDDSLNDTNKPIISDTTPVDAADNSLTTQNNHDRPRSVASESRFMEINDDKDNFSIYGTPSSEINENMNTLFSKPEANARLDKLDNLESDIERHLDDMSHNTTTNREAPQVPKHDDGKRNYRHSSADLQSPSFRDTAADDAMKSVYDRMTTTISQGGKSDRVLKVREGFQNFTGFGVKCVSEDASNDNERATSI